MNDQSDTLSAVSCPNCGVSRPPELAHTATRPPCPECGETGIAISLGIVDEVNVGDELSVSMSPRDQKRGWRRRWAELQRDLERLDAPRTEQLSGEAVHAALHELQSFYVQAYHIKDALRDEAPALGVTIDQIEAAVANDPDLALLADLANLDKHVKLDRPPRSGDVPAYEAEGVQSGSGEGGWRLRLTIPHKGATRDGLEVARAAGDAWRRLLEGWGLLSVGP